MVIVYFGGNDSLLPHPSGRGQHVPLQEYIENMRKIGSHLKVKTTHISFLITTWKKPFTLQVFFTESPSFYLLVITAMFDTNPCDCQSLSKKTRIIFLTAPPVNEAHLTGNRFWLQSNCYFIFTNSQKLKGRELHAGDFFTEVKTDYIMTNIAILRVAKELVHRSNELDFICINILISFYFSLFFRIYI